MQPPLPSLDQNDSRQQQSRPESLADLPGSSSNHSQAVHPAKPDLLADTPRPSSPDRPDSGLANPIPQQQQPPAAALPALTSLPLPNIICPPQDPQPTTTPHKKRRVQWVGLSEKDNSEETVCSFPPAPAAFTPQQQQQQLSDSFSDHPRQHPHQHQHHHLQAHLPPSPNSSTSLLFGRPLSVPIPDRPSADQLLHQAQLSNLLQPPKPSSGFRPSAANLNKAASSSSTATVTASTNPYFPPILPTPHPHSQPLSSTTYFPNNNNTNNNGLPSYLPRHRHSPSDHSIIPMATPDSSRPGTPDSGLDIPFGERDGLPSNPNRKPRTFTREAANLVSLHKFKFGGAFGRSANPTSGGGGSSGQSAPAPPAGGKRLGTAASHNAAVRENRALGNGFGASGAGRPGMGMGGGLSVGNGVLSSLLHLYTHPTSAQSSSATLINYASDDESDGGGEGSQDGRGGAAAGRTSMDSATRARAQPAPQTSMQMDERGAPNQTRHGRNTSTSSSIRSSFDAVLGTRQRIFQGISKVAGSLQLERPAGARSKAGVFGALQASAIGLGGVAAPAATHIAPAPAKSGFRLARYTGGSEEPLVGTGPLTPSSDNPYGLPPTFHSPEDESALRRLRRVGSGDEVDDVNLSPPDTANIMNQYGFGGLGSSASSSTGSIFKGRLPKSGSIASLKALGDALKPAKFHNESAVLRAKKIGNGSGSTPGTPRDDPFNEKSPAATPIGTHPPTAAVAAKAHHHNQVSRRRREKRRQEEIFITMHVAAILQRQQFILQLTRALMMFGGPSHRLESQIQATARVLEIDLQIVLIYSLCIFSFQDDATHTSETKFIKQSPNVDLGKLTDLATLHWEVVHDKIGVQEASQEISRLMRAKPEYGAWKTVLIGAMCSAFIGPAAFNSSVLDVLVSAPLGAVLVAAQLFVASKSDVLSQIFEIVVTGFTSFVAAGLASTGMFCYSAVIASSIVLILPGWLVCCAALELQSRSIVSGSVRLIWAVIYALFLGLGISLGAEFWTLFSGKVVQVSVDGTCAASHTSNHWYRQTIPLWSAFVTVPGYALFLAMRQQARLNTKETWVMVLLACGGWTANHFAAVGFPARSDISSALGSFVVGFAANVYGRLFQGTAFIVALVPILFQLPSGLGNGGGLLYFANTGDSSKGFVNGFQVGEQLIEVSLGLVIGLFVATVLVYPFGHRRGGLMTF